MRMSEEAWREVLETNLFGAFYMTKAVTRPMLKAQGRPDHQHHLGLRPGRPDGPGQLLVGEGRPDRADQGDRPRAGEPRRSRSTPSRPGFVLTELTQDLPEALQAEITARTPLGRFGDDRGDRGRRRVPRQRRGRVHHRPGPRRRRRPGDDVDAAIRSAWRGTARARVGALRSSLTAPSGALAPVLGAALRLAPSGATILSSLRGQGPGVGCAHARHPVPDRGARSSLDPHRRRRGRRGRGHRPAARRRHLPRCGSPGGPADQPRPRDPPPQRLRLGWPRARRADRCQPRHRGRRRAPPRPPAGP